MLLRENTLTQFTEVLSSDAPVPGGGSIAALNGALAAALLHMVGCLTAGNEKYEEFHAEIQEIMVNAKRLQNALLIVVDEDTEAFNKISAVFSMPEETDREKSAKNNAMQAALKSATLTPLAILKAAHGCLTLAALAYGKLNTSCVSDFGCSVLCALASARSAWLKVKINLSGINDEVFRKKNGSEARKILADSERVAEELYNRIEQAL